MVPPHPADERGTHARTSRAIKRAGGLLRFSRRVRGTHRRTRPRWVTPLPRFSRRLNFLYPHINKKYLNYALDSGIWQFGPVTADAPSYTVLACGLWYVFAEAYDLPPEPEYAALILDCDIIHDLPPALEARHFSNEDIAHVLAKIGATLKYLAAHPYSQLEEEAYAQTLEDIRLRGVKEIGTEGGSLYTLLAASMEGESAWPAPAQTVNDYLGDGNWSLGMLRTGHLPGGGARERVVYRRRGGT